MSVCLPSLLLSAPPRPPSPPRSTSSANSELFTPPSFPGDVFLLLSYTFVFSENVTCRLSSKGIDNQTYFWKLSAINIIVNTRRVVVVDFDSWALWIVHWPPVLPHVKCAISLPTYSEDKNNDLDENLKLLCEGVRVIVTGVLINTSESAWSIIPVRWAQQYDSNEVTQLLLSRVYHCCILHTAYIAIFVH